MRRKHYIYIYFLINLFVYSQDILVLNYFSKGNYESDEIIKGIENNSMENQKIYIEYLGIDQNLTSEYRDKVEEFIKFKYKDLNFDYVININIKQQYFNEIFEESTHIYTNNIANKDLNITLSTNNLEKFIENILHIQPLIKKLYIQNISLKDLIYFKKKYFYIEFEQIDLDNSVGVALLDYLNSSEGLLLTEPITSIEGVEKLKNLNAPIYAFKLNPEDYYSVVFQEDLYTTGYELITLLSQDKLVIEKEKIQLLDSIYLFNARDLKRFRIFYRDIQEKVIFFNENEFFLLINKSLVKNLSVLFLITFSSFCIFVLFKWRMLIKQLLKLKSQAEKHNEVKSQFLANMTHEIRTPLNGILGMADIMKDDNLEENSKIKLSIIKNSANHLLNIVNEILDFSKIQARQILINEDIIDFNKLFKEINNIFFNPIQKKGLILCFFIDKNIPKELIGDYQKMKQVLINLVGNAIKFTKEGEVIVKVKVIHRGKKCKLLFTIKDSGIGISHHKKEELFESFTQLDSSYGRSYEGTGLGLSITKSFLLHMKSKIRLISIEGKGSLFYFLIDFKINGLEVDNISKNCQYLILEDNKKIKSYLFEMLGEYRIPYITPFDFEEFQEIFQEFIVEPHNRLIISENIYFQNIEFFREYFISKTKHKGKVKILVNSYKNSNFFKSLGINYSLKNPLFQSELLDFSMSRLILKKDIEKEEFLNKKVLIIEDNATNAQVLIFYLKRFNIECVHAENSNEALIYMEKERYSLIFMDIQLPTTNGFELTRRILEKGYKTPIIAVTAHVIKGYKEKCIASGMSDYISKPIIYEELKDILNLYCGYELINIPNLINIYGIGSFKNLSVSFRNSVDLDIKKLGAAIETSDFENIKFYCHKIKGSLLNFKATPIINDIERLEIKEMSKKEAELIYRNIIRLIKIIIYQMEDINL